jgi:thioredoxin family protein
MKSLDFRALWYLGLTYGQFTEQAREQRELWTGVYRLARTPRWALTRMRAAGQRIRLLVLVEDWCGDGANVVPHLARLADEAPGVELRVLRRDEHPDVMDRYLTGTARAIPIVIVLDGEFRELGHWGSRPAPLQAWVTEARRTVSKDELYPQIRRWYAKDKGESTLREVLALVAPGGAEEELAALGAAAPAGHQ